MPFPVAHALIGASAAAALDRRSAWRFLLLSALLGVCPDFDYLLNLLRVGRGGWHHGFTHSIIFALIVGALTALICGWRSVSGFFALSAATVSHTLLDYFMTESRGVALWWPFTDRRYKFRGPNPIDYTWSNDTFMDAAIDILRISLVEVMLFAPVLLFVLLMRKLSKR